jgi:CHAD domain-containing protein
MSDLPADLLTRPVEEATRLVALQRLDAAAAALERRRENDDPEALHDFRVALRRLRSLIRAYRRYLQGVARQRVRRRLRRLVRETNAGRDAEVLLDWLRVQHDGLSARERAGWRWLVARVETRERDAAAALTGVAARFGKLNQRLRRRLARYRMTVDLGDGAGAGATFGTATAGALRDLAEDLSQRLAAPAEPGDAAAVHAARISAKRLRYLLEPVAGAVGGEAALEQLRGLQDLLGELNDAHVAERELAAAVEAAGAERARALFDAALSSTPAPTPAPRRQDERAGLVTLARLARARWDREYARFDREWLGDRAAAFIAEIETLADRLESPTETRPTAATEPGEPAASGAGGGRWSAAARAARRHPRTRRGA